MQTPIYAHEIDARRAAAAALSRAMNEADQAMEALRLVLRALHDAHASGAPAAPTARAMSQAAALLASVEDHREQLEELARPVADAYEATLTAGELADLKDAHRTNADLPAHLVTLIRAEHGVNPERAAP